MIDEEEERRLASLPIEECEKECERLIKCAKRESELEIRRMKKEHEAKMRKISEDHETKMRKIDEDHETKMREIDEEHEEWMKEHEAKMLKINEEHEEWMKEHEAKMKKLEQRKLDLMPTGRSVIFTSLFKMACLDYEHTNKSMRGLVQLTPSIRFESSFSEETVEKFASSIKEGLKQIYTSSFGKDEQMFQLTFLDFFEPILRKCYQIRLKALIASSVKIDKKRNSGICLAYNHNPGLYYATIELQKVGTNLEEAEFVDQFICYMKHMIRNNPTLEHVSCMLFNGQEFVIYRYDPYTAKKRTLRRTSIIKLFTKQRKGTLAINESGGSIVS